MNSPTVNGVKIANFLKSLQFYRFSTPVLRRRSEKWGKPHVPGSLCCPGFHRRRVTFVADDVFATVDDECTSPSTVSSRAAFAALDFIVGDELYSSPTIKFSPYKCAARSRECNSRLVGDV